MPEPAWAVIAIEIGAPISSAIASAMSGMRFLYSSITRSSKRDAVGLRCLREAVERAAGGLHRLVDIGGGAERDLETHLLGRRD